MIFPMCRAAVTALQSFLFIILALSCATGNGQDATTIAATVDGEPIAIAEVEREVTHVVRDKKIEGPALRLLQAQALQQMIDQRLVLLNLEKSKQAASKQDVDLSLDRFVKQLKLRGITLQHHLKQIKLSEADVRRQMRWSLSWERYLQRYLTDENLEKYFEKHRRDFDGTELRVSHILIKIAAPADEAAVAVTLKQAADLRDQIKAGKIKFAEAAAKHSAAPTGKSGGDIGFIERHDPMPESFSAAAFALEKDDIGGPVLTTFGVHLIQCLEIKPGKKTWQEVRTDLEPAVSEFLFTRCADQERPLAKIEFTGVFPHFKPGTRELSTQP